MDNAADESVNRHLADLRLALGARAAGYWWHAGDWLEQVALAFSPTFDPAVAQTFKEITRSVALEKTDLGIVRAAVADEPVVSRVSDLPGASGSGYWLRAFGAERSVAVPLHDPSTAVRAIVSVALAADNPLDDGAVVERIRSTVRQWVPLF